MTNFMTKQTYTFGLRIYSTVSVAYISKFCAAIIADTVRLVRSIIYGVCFLVAHIKL